MTRVFRDEHRYSALHALTTAGCAEGTDWRWASVPVPSSVPLVLDSPNCIQVYEWAAEDGEPPAPVILVRASAVRKLGGPGAAARMESGVFPAEMPYATVAFDPGQVN